MGDELLLRRVVVPVANEGDAVRTCSALVPRLRDHDSDVIVVHVIEKAGGYMDKAPLRARQEQAGRIFDIVRREFVSAELEVEAKLLYGTDVVETILGAADDLDASAIVLTPREGTGRRERLRSLLAGDVGYRLLKNERHPVVVVPRSREAC